MIRNKKAQEILVRMPLGSIRRQSRARSTAGPRPILERPICNLRFRQERRHAGLEFPVVESDGDVHAEMEPIGLLVRVHWAQRGWKTANEKYVCTFRGNTLMKITPMPGAITDGPAIRLPPGIDAGHEAR